MLSRLPVVMLSCSAWLLLLFSVPELGVLGVLAAGVVISVLTVASLRSQPVVRAEEDEGIRTVP